MDFSKFKPLRGTVLVRRDAKKSIDGNIVLPELWQQYGWRASVVAVGAEVANCKPGDEILFLKEYTVLPFPERDMAITECKHILGRIVAENFVERIILQEKFIMVVEDKPKVKPDGIVLVNPREPAKSGFVYKVAAECLDIKAGDRIFYDKSVAVCVEDGRNYKIVAEPDVLATFI